MAWTGGRELDTPVTGDGRKRAGFFVAKSYEGVLPGETYFVRINRTYQTTPPLPGRHFQMQGCLLGGQWSNLIIQTAIGPANWLERNTNLVILVI